jgi:3D (Asp-Asp-Asp) domain-containing protein
LEGEERGSEGMVSATSIKMVSEKGVDSSDDKMESGSHFLSASKVRVCGSGWRVLPPASKVEVSESDWGLAEDNIEVVSSSSVG